MSLGGQFGLSPNIQEGEIGNPVLIGGDTVHVARSGTTVFFDKVLGFVQFSAIPLGG